VSTASVATPYRALFAEPVLALGLSFALAVAAAACATAGSRDSEARADPVR
jgi:hypothetical protein